MEIMNYSLRIDADVYEKLKERAKEEDRSINSMIIYIIKQYLKK